MSCSAWGQNDSVYKQVYADAYVGCEFGNQGVDAYSSYESSMIYAHGHSWALSTGEGGGSFDISASASAYPDGQVTSDGGVTYGCGYADGVTPY